MNLSPLRNLTSLLLIAIVVLAFALRLYNLNVQSLWVDEIVSMTEVDPELRLDEVIQKTVIDQPPAFFIALHGWFNVVEYNEFNGRLFSVFTGIACVIAMFFLGKEAKDEKVGLTAALLTAVNYMSILFSQEIRFYSFLFLFTTLSYFFFIRAVKCNKILDFIFYSLSTILVAYTHYYGLVVIASQGIIFLGLVLIFPTNKKFITSAIISALIIISAFSPWLPIIFSDFQTPEFWIKNEPFYFPIVYFYVYFKDIFACSVFAISIILYFIKIFKNLKEKQGIDNTTFILIGWGIFSYLIPLIYSIVRIPMLQVRYTIIALPCLIIIISLGFFILKEKLRTILLIITCCTIIFSLIFIENYYTKIRKEDWRGVISSVVKQAGPQDVIISDYAYYCNYYFKALGAEFRAIVPGEMNLSSFPVRIWWIDGFHVHVENTHTENTLIERGYIIQKTDSLFNVKASLYLLPREN